MSVLEHQTKANVNSALYAPAGSGGGGGSNSPNLLVSTLTVNPLGAITFANDASLDSAGIQFDIDQAGTSSFQLAIGYAQNEAGAQVGLGMDFTLANGSNNPVYGSIAVSQVRISGGAYSSPQAVLEPAPTGIGMYVSSLFTSSIANKAVMLEDINAAGQFPYRLRANSGSVLIENNATGDAGDLTLSTLTVSSINGAAPGGGSVGPNLTLSTLTLGVGQNSGPYNLLLGPGILNLAQVGDSNGMQLGSSGNDLLVGNQYVVQGNFANGAQGDITFGDKGGANSAFVGINYQANGFVSGNVSTVIYGHTRADDLHVSSINGAAYPPAAPGVGVVSTTNIGFTQQYNSAPAGSGILIGVSTIYSSPTFMASTIFTLAGGLTGQVNFQGNGNTNPLTNSTLSGNANYRMNLLIDEGQPTQATVPICLASFTTANNSPPTTNTSWRPASWSNVSYQGTTFMVNAAPDYNTPPTYGQEGAFTCYGQHSYKVLFEIDALLSSGDPGATYNMFLQIPGANQTPLYASYL